MTTSMFSELVWKIKDHAWLSVDSGSDYEYIQNLYLIAYFKVIMCSCKLCSSRTQGNPRELFLG